MKDALRRGQSLFAVDGKTGLTAHALTYDEARAAMGDDLPEFDRLTQLLKDTLNAAVPGTVTAAPPTGGQ